MFFAFIAFFSQLSS